MPTYNSVELKKGKYVTNDLFPYASVEEANAATVERDRYDERYIEVDGVVLVYWYRDGILDEHLIPKEAGLTIEEILEVTNNLYAPIQSANGIASGGIVTWLQNYDYYVSPAIYFINGVRYESPGTFLTLSPSDPDDDRIDVFVLTSSNTAEVREGTPSDTPQEPEIDVENELRASFVIVTAGSTEPDMGGTTREYIYKENIEWTTSVSANINANSTSSPLYDTKSVEATSAANTNFVLFTNSGDFDSSSATKLVFAIKSKGAWGNRKLTLRFYLDGGPVGAAVVFGNGDYGFTANNTTDIQVITIPFEDFGSPATVEALRATVTFNGGGTIGWIIDNVYIESTEGGGGGAFIPLAGTDVGSPVTGDIEMSDYLKIYWNSSVDDLNSWILSEEGGLGFTYFDGLTYKGNFTGIVSAGVFEMNISTDGTTSRGIYADKYYGANYDDNTYIQKKYVDDLIGDLGRFGFSGEDDTASENRIFDIDGNEFRLINGNFLRFEATNGSVYSRVDAGLTAINIKNFTSGLPSEINMADGDIDISAVNMTIQVAQNFAFLLKSDSSGSPILSAREFISIIDPDREILFQGAYGNDSVYMFVSPTETRNYFYDYAGNDFIKLDSTSTLQRLLMQAAGGNDYLQVISSTTDRNFNVQDFDGNDFFKIYSDSSGRYIQFKDGSENNGYVWTSDSNGIGTWQPASGGSSSRFGFATEDDTAGENRSFDANGYNFSINGSNSTVIASQGLMTISSASDAVSILATSLIVDIPTKGNAGDVLVSIDSDGTTEWATPIAFGTDTNFAENDLSFTGDRLHDLNTNTLTIFQGVDGVSDFTQFTIEDNHIKLQTVDAAGDNNSYIEMDQSMLVMAKNGASIGLTTSNVLVSAGSVFNYSNISVGTTSLDLSSDDLLNNNNHLISIKEEEIEISAKTSNVASTLNLQLKLLPADSTANILYYDSSTGTVSYEAIPEPKYILARLHFTGSGDPTVSTVIYNNTGGTLNISTSGSSEWTALNIAGTTEDLFMETHSMQSDDNTVSLVCHWYYEGTIPSQTIRLHWNTVAEWYCLVKISLIPA